MAESISKMVEEWCNQLTIQECEEMLHGIGIDTDSFQGHLGLYRHAVYHAVITGDLHPRDVKAMLDKRANSPAPVLRTFEIKKRVTIQLPLTLVAKRNGYMASFQPGKGWVEETGPLFCQVGKGYELVSVDEFDGAPEFTMLTEQHHENGSISLTSHLMPYDFMCKYFHVIF